MTKRYFLPVVVCIIFCCIGISNVNAQNIIFEDPLSTLTKNENNKVAYLKLVNLKVDIQRDNQQLIKEVMDLKSFTKKSKLLEEILMKIRKYESVKGVKVLSNKLYEDNKISQHTLSKFYINLDSFFYFSNLLKR